MFSNTSGCPSNRNTNTLLRLIEQSTCTTMTDRISKFALCVGKVFLCFSLIPVSSFRSPKLTLTKTNITVIAVTIVAFALDYVEYLSFFLKLKDGGLFCLTVIVFDHTLTVMFYTFFSVNRPNLNQIYKQIEWFATLKKHHSRKGKNVSELCALMVSTLGGYVMFLTLFRLRLDGNDSRNLASCMISYITSVSLQPIYVFCWSVQYVLSLAFLIESRLILLIIYYSPSPEMSPFCSASLPDVEDIESNHSFPNELGSSGSSQSGQGSKSIQQLRMCFTLRNYRLQTLGLLYTVNLIHMIITSCYALFLLSKDFLENSILSVQVNRILTSVALALQIATVVLTLSSNIYCYNLNLYLLIKTKRTVFRSSDEKERNILQKLVSVSRNKYPESPCLFLSLDLDLASELANTLVLIALTFFVIK